jgi:hypothetical protein
MRGRRRTYEDYEEMGRYLKAAEEAVHRAQTKSFDMFGGLDPLTEVGETVTLDTRPSPTSYDKEILQLVVTLNNLRSELAMNFHAEIAESEVPPGKPRTPPPFDRGEGP